MADLNPLKFAVAIEDEATGQLNKIEKEFEKLKDKSISVKVEGLEDLRSLLALLGQKQPSNVGNSVSQEVEVAVAALKKEEDELAKLKQVAEKNGIGSAIAEDLKKAEEKLNTIQSQLKRLAEMRAEAEKVINAAHGVYGGSPWEVNYRNSPSLQNAWDKDKAEQEKIIAALDKKWETYWQKQEQEAQRFALICKKSFEQVGFSDFYKHVLSGGDIASAAKSWLRFFTRDMYGDYFGKDGDLYKEMANMRHMQRAGSLSKEMEEELKVLEAYQRKYTDFWKQRRQAEQSMPRYDSAYSQLQKDQELYSNAQARVAAAIKAENGWLEQQAAAQQKVNELKAQASAQEQKSAQSKAAVIAQEEKVAQAKEKVAQLNQQQAQSSQQEAQGVKQVGDAAQTTSEQIQKLAQSAIKGSFEQFVKDLFEVKNAIKNDNFTAFSKRIETCAEAMKKLTEAFSAFKATIGDNKDLKDLMTGWGAAIREVSAAIAAMNATKKASTAQSSSQKEETRQQAQGLIQVADALGRVRSAAAAAGGGSIPFMESITTVGERNIQTLIKEQGHIERLIAIAQKSITFGEGHPVLGMGRLRGDQMQNLRDLEAIKKTINEILFAATQGDQAAIRFLNTIGSLKTHPFGKDAMGNDVTLLGGHFDKLTHSVTGTASAMRTLEREMRLDSNVWPNSEQDSNLRRYNQMLVEAEKLLRRIDTAGAKGFGLGLDTSLTRVGSRDVTAFIEKALKFQDVGNFRALNELIGQFQRLKAVYGEVATEQEKMNNKRVALGEKADAQYMREVEQYTKKCIQEYNAWQESIRRAGVEVTNLNIKLREMRAVERRGSEAGVDTTALRSRIAALRQERDILKEIHDGSKAYGLSKDYIKSERYNERIKLAQEEAKIVARNAAEKEKADNKAIRDLDTIETNQRRYNQLLSEAQALQERLANASTKGAGMLIDVSKTEAALNQLQQHIDRVLNFDMRNLKDNHSVNELIASWNALKRTLFGVATEQEKLNATTEKTNKANLSEAAKKAQQENDKWEESMRRARIEATKLEIQIRKLREAEKTGNEAKVDTSGLSSKIAQLESYLQLLRSMSFGAKIHGTAGDLVNSAAFQSTSKLANEAAAAVNKNATEKERAANATRQLTAEEQRLSQALSQSTEHMKGQSQVLSDLKTMATQYLGVWGGQQFLNNIIQIGGQLEMQRLSIGAILQNQAQANTLFNQIKGLATQSPFGVVELDQMTKQLTAYGFKYHDLFDMTKRLADISAATGTSVDRLALALGHVRSEAALSGYTLRQFSMGNVPLLEKLSEKLGKSTKQIRDMVKKKEISYDDVIGVLKDLTDEGGMFYNMQEVISESVKAKFKNVKDAMDIMYGEMAEGGIGEALKAIASGLMEVTRNWKDAATIITSGAAAWALCRGVTLLYTQTLGSANAQTLASIAAHRQKEVALLKEATYYRTLTAAERDRLAATKSLTMAERVRIALGRQMTTAQRSRIVLSRQQKIMDLSLAVSEKKLTVEGLARQVALGKLSKAQARAIIGLADLSAVERQAAIQAINGTKQVTMFGMAMNTLWGATKRAGVALTSFLLNPAMLAMAGISAIVELLMRNSRELERADELADSIYQHSQDAIQNTKTLMQKDIAPMSIVDNEGKDVDTADLGLENINNVKIKFPEVDKSDMKQVIEDWTNYIENFAVNAGQLLNNAFFDADKNLLPLEERFENLKSVMEQVILAQYGLQDIGDVFGNAVKSTDNGIFDDDVTKDIEQYIKKYKDFTSNVASTYSKYRRAVDSGIKAALKQDETFAKATKGMDTYAAKFKFLAENQTEYVEAWKAFQSVEGLGDAVSNINSSITATTTGDVNDARKEMQAELESYYIQLEAELQTKGVDVNRLTVQQQQALLIGYKKHLESIQGMSKEMMETLMKDFANRFNIEISLDDSKFIPKVDEVTQILNDLVEGDWKVDLTFAENINSAIDEARKKYKFAKEFFEKTAPIRLKFGIDMKLGQILSKEQMDAILAKVPNKEVRDQLEGVLKGLNQVSEGFNKAVESSQNLGFSLEDEKKNKKKEKKKTGTKTFKDEFAKRWDERIRIMQDAYNMYDKWEKKVGHDEAIKEVREQYQKLFDEWSRDKTVPFTLKVENIKDFREQVEQYLEAARKRYADQTSSEANKKKYNNGEEALRVVRTAEKLLADMKFDNFTKAAEDFKSIIEQTITDLNDRWDIYDTVRNATGNPQLASRVAGFGASDADARTAADAIRNELLSQLRAAGGEDFSIFLDVRLDEKGIRSSLEEAIPQAEDVNEYKKKIEGLLKIYQEWQKLQQKVEKDDISVFANLIGSVVSYDAKIKKLNDDLDKKKGSISAALATGYISQNYADQATDIAQTQFDWETMKLSADYANIYNHAIAMSREEFNDAADSIEVLIQKLRDLGLITSEDYLSEQNKLDKARKEWGETGFLGERGAVGQFISGGFDGLLNYYGQRRDKARESAEKETDTKKKADFENEAKHYGELFKRLSKLSDSAKDVVTAFQTLQSGLELVGNLFDSLGMEGAANFAGDAAGLLGGAMQGASSLSALGPYGMAAGAALGLIGGMAQVHDKALERQIGKLREDVQRIEGNTKLIQQARSRTLGFDTGEIRSSYSDIYNVALPWYKYLNGTFRAYNDMSEYYSRNSSGTGYQQEYQNLIEEREKYIQILSKQEQKKDKSQSDIDETMSKISELDDQIRFFTQDMAKELFNIDVKGWADQLSDALASAFENGENMAKAYKDTVTNILQQVMQKMMQVAILEPMFQRLQDRLFGNAQKNITGVFNPNDPSGSMSKVTAMISEFFGKGGEGEKTITAAKEFMTAFQRGVQTSGLSILNESTNTLSSSIQGTSEETSNLLAGYVNALRQDVSVNRLLFTQFVAQLWPEYITAFAAHVRTVANIDVNVQVMMEMLRDGRGAMFDEIHSLRSRVDNVVNGIESFAMK